jgi:hypothetical protein
MPVKYLFFIFNGLWKTISQPVLSLTVFTIGRRPLCRSGGLGGEWSVEGFVQRMEPNIFDRHGVLVHDIEFAPAAGLAHGDPVGGFVAGAAEAIRLHDGTDRPLWLGVCMATR